MNSTFKSLRSKHIVRTSGQNKNFDTVGLFNIVRWHLRHAEKNSKQRDPKVEIPSKHGRVNASFVESPQSRDLNVASANKHFSITGKE